ncbi:hypothetical protein [Tsukamurella sp. NPDC003166]|uniref:hypothetical protein n=1 Tax=Tsukamurella sp. NPDC003166 TaxID=3154444 RepID=UPI0033A1E54A
MSTVPRRIGLACGVTAVGALSLVSVAACGAQSSTPSPTAAAASSSAAPSKHAGVRNAAYRQCLEQNGVVFPAKGAKPSGTVAPSEGAQPSGTPSANPRGGARRMGPPAGVSQDTWDKAVAACASVKPSKAHTAPTT